mmetsp:Transcript_13309/g.55906  ORF Transcript_13309/g.55906 Transcript_13309/m.55906 type:complete len:288 (-) Transcript_13309:608-1471(-)
MPLRNRTPHALHSVFGPVGPMRHCGVFWHPQFRHPRRTFCPSAVMMLSVAFGAQATADGLARFAARGGSAAGSVASLSSMSVLSPASRERAGSPTGSREERLRARVAAGELTSASALAGSMSTPPRSERVGVRTPELSRERLDAFAEARAFPRGDPALRARDIDVRVVFSFAPETASRISLARIVSVVAFAVARVAARRASSARARAWAARALASSIDAASRSRYSGTSEPFAPPREDVPVRSRSSASSYSKSKSPAARAGREGVGAEGARSSAPSAVTSRGSDGKF